MKHIIRIVLIGSLFLSCKKKEIPGITKPPPVVLPPGTSPYIEDRMFSNVLIVGNSITRATPEPSIGWNNNWGMAATKAEYDYVHLLTARLQAVNPAIKVNNIPSGEFELGYSNFDYAKYYAAVKATKPDLLILRFGENVNRENPDLSKFDAKYLELINYFKDGNPNLKILAVGSFWGNPVVDDSMKKHSKFVTLTPLLNDIKNQAFGDFENYNVAIHPSNKGMQLIADIIWEGLKGM